MKYWILFLIQLTSLSISAQEQVGGKVVSEKGNPLAGASVFIPNTSIGTTTDKNGEFVLLKLPRGNFKIAASFINYETVIKNIPNALRGIKHIIRLKPKAAELDEVVIRQYDKEGWKKWGGLFIASFIGESAYAQDCDIVNKDIIRFIHVANSNIIRAYAAEPLMIENKSLGYRLKVELSDFQYDLSRSEVDYQVYTFFTPMEGTTDDIKKWKGNRETAYQFSLMRFMRSLYDSSYEDKGYEIRLIEKKPNEEKQRILDLYKMAMDELKASGDDKKLQGKNFERLAEKKFKRDSVKYYHRILQQEDKVKKFHQELLPTNRFITTTDSGTVIFGFDQSLQVINRKLKEPIEYYNYRNNIPQSNTKLDEQLRGQVKPDPPLTELTLTQQIPVEINENGYFNNIDLFINGFWGWWEKIAVKLPYEYTPDE